MVLLLLTAISGLLFTIVYLYSKWALSYWSRRGVETYKAKGSNAREIAFQSYSYFRSKGLKHGGLYLLLTPIYLVVDLELLKAVMQKNFENFMDHGLYVHETADPLSANLFNAEGEKWRNLRVKLTPTFTSGRIKMMYQTMVDCTVSLVDILKENASMGDPVNITKVIPLLTTDIIGSVFFGVDCNSLKDPDCEFRKIGKQITLRTWRSKVSRVVPESLLHALNFSSRPKDMEDFFINFVKTVIDYREKNNIYRKDFMHMLLQLKNRGKIVDDEKIMDDGVKGNYMTLNDIAAQCFIFFLGGFDTSSQLMTFALVELAQHQDMQDRLREEMKTAIKKNGGMTYDAIMQMSYLDQVANEILRLHPPTLATIRRCTKDFVVPETKTTIEKGTQVFIPIFSIHHDPEYYPDPDKFDPERFSPENKAKRHPFAFIPFGEGPRMCIGARLGLLQAKVGLTSILTNFKVTLNFKTKIPVEYNSDAILLAPKDDIWLNISSVENS